MKAMIALIALSLSACTAGTPPPTTPAAVDDTTTFDEQAALAVELAYQAAAQTVLATGAAKSPAVKAADQRAYAAVKAVRAAYDAGNAQGYLAAVVSARSAVASLLSAIRG